MPHNFLSDRLLDQPALQPLPVERYEVAQWKTVRANLDYHVEVERRLYSVPYQLTGQQLEARYTATTVEIFHRGVRVASHVRSDEPHRATTVAEHRPKSHQAHLEWTPSRLIHWAETVGPATAEVVRTILENKPHPEMGYRAAPAWGFCGWPKPIRPNGWKPPAGAPWCWEPARIRA